MIAENHESTGQVGDESETGKAGMMKVGLVNEAARWFWLYAFALTGCLATPASEGSHASEGSQAENHQRQETSAREESTLSFVAGLPCSGSWDCGRRAYCQYPEGQCGGAGTCEPSPRACTHIFAPVCGCDDQTYANACAAAAAGISVQGTGECASRRQSEGSDDGVPVLGQDGVVAP